MTLLTAVAAAAAALALALQQAPAPPPAAPPPPDPRLWWDAPQVKPPTPQDPLGGRRAGRRARPGAWASPAEPLLYRLWGLPPLQTQLLRRGEAVLEVWVRPSGGVRQQVVRLTLRGDGRVFVQARAGLGCCRPEIERRVDMDLELPPERAAALAPAIRAAAADPAWATPTAVRAQEAGAVQGLCLAGSAYDLVLASQVAGARAAHLRRDCDPAEIGQVAPLLSLVLGAALGADPRFDVLFPRGVAFTAEAEEHRRLLAAGGALAPERQAPEPDLTPPEPEADEPESAPPAAGSPPPPT